MNLFHENYLSSHKEACNTQLTVFVFRPGAQLLRHACGCHLEHAGSAAGSAADRAEGDVLSPAAALGCYRATVFALGRAGAAGRLVGDLRTCLGFGLPDFRRMLPVLLSGMPDLTAGRPDFLYLLAATADAGMLLGLAAGTSRGSVSVGFPAPPRMEVCTDSISDSSKSTNVFFELLFSVRNAL